MVKKVKKVHGVGANDCGYPVSIFGTVSGKSRRLWMCPYYSTWCSMLNRCYNTKTQARYPTYIGCTVAPEWLSFSAFRAWMLTQDWEGKHLDKDLLVIGNKLYSPEMCVFVPGKLNTFLNDCGSARGDWPVGVDLHKSSGKFRANCCNPLTGKREYLGLFGCPDSAREAWRARKHELALRYADQQTDPRIAQALRARYATKPEGEIA